MTRISLPVLHGARRAFGIPCLVLSASMIGFGSLAREYDFSVWMTIATTMGVYGLPGQMVMVEMAATGASLFAIISGVAVANARFLPMTLALVPQFNPWSAPLASRLMFCHLVTLTPWVVTMKAFPSIPRTDRPSFFVGYSLVCFVGASMGTVIGYEVSGSLPDFLVSALIFLNPAFFAMVCLDVRLPGPLLAIIIGGVISPWMYDLSADWWLPLTGLIAGTVAFILTRNLAKNVARTRITEHSDDAG